MEEAEVESRVYGEAGGIQVLLGEEGAPHCPHGPTLLFVKSGQGKEDSRRFYACSACRDRKDCQFFQWADEKVSEARLQAREEYNRSCQPPLTHDQYTKRFQEFIRLPLAKRKFCQNCQQLLLENEWQEHSGHHIKGDVSASLLKRPSQLLHPLENKKSNAQYLFADRSCSFLLETISRLGYTRVLCVGTPRLHEWIRSQASESCQSKVKSLLLDIDFRYSQFYNKDEFCHYNMFNHHFFSGKAPLSVCQQFLQEDDGEGVIMVTDPPFGGLVEPLAFSFKKMSKMWRTPNTGDAVELPTFWIFPYFFEPRIVQSSPGFSMLDYQVDYDNHTQYKHGKTGRKQSPVRIFTNLSLETIVLPASEGYRFCTLCQRYVSSENKHCEICNSCTSKDGREWKHCSLCSKCVKPSWSHCSSCDHCALQDHPCGRSVDGCFLCGGKDHKRRRCPQQHTAMGNNKKIKMQTKLNKSMNTKRSIQFEVSLGCAPSEGKASRGSQSDLALRVASIEGQLARLSADKASSKKRHLTTGLSLFADDDDYLYDSYGGPESLEEGEFFHDSDSSGDRHGEYDSEPGSSSDKNFGLPDDTNRFLSAVFDAFHIDPPKTVKRKQGELFCPDKQCLEFPEQVISIHDHILQLQVLGFKEVLQLEKTMQSGSPSCASPPLKEQGCPYTHLFRDPSTAAMELPISLHGQWLHSNVPTALIDCSRSHGTRIPEEFGVWARTGVYQYICTVVVGKLTDDQDKRPVFGDSQASVDWCISTEDEIVATTQLGISRLLIPLYLFQGVTDAQDKRPVFGDGNSQASVDWYIGTEDEISNL
ncbi:rRNA N(6)-adenosine-methyltransferase ZCCHC4 [Gastrophryne carolinensis]